jgi:enoyl-CoA hydratase/carnithine racemase
MLEIFDHGPVREIKLARPPANALNGSLLHALGEALETASKEAEAIVVSGAPGMFSAGLDVPELIKLDRPAFTLLWRQFIDLQRAIAQMPVPTVFALTGHAPAGAIVLAVFGDYRIMPEGSFKTGLNEVRIGLVVPEQPFGALVRLIGPRAAEEMVVSGEMINAGKAAQIGLVDELVPSPEDVVPRAVEWCNEHLSLPRQALKLSRQMARADLQELFDDKDELRGDRFIDLWFSESTQAMLHELVARLKKS